jgi:hypothetical protein
MLEAFASEREIVASELQDLNAKILKLENEKIERSESRKRFEKVSFVFMVESRYAGFNLK